MPIPTVASHTEPNAVQLRLVRLLDYLATDPRNPHLLSESADAQLQLGQWGEAKACLTQLLEVSPNNVEARYRLAIAERMCGNTEAAVQHLQALQREGYSNLAVLRELAVGQAAVGQWKEAFETLKALDPIGMPVEEGDTVWLLRVRAAHHLGDLPGADIEARNWLASRNTPLPLRGMAAIATLYIDMEQFGEAAKILQRLPDETVAGDAELNVAAGFAEMSRGIAGKALIRFSETANAQPEFWRAHLGKGLAAAFVGNTVEAMNALRTATKLAPTHLGTWHALAWLQLLTQDLNGAAVSFGEALTQDAAFGESHGGLALIAALNGDRDAAELHLRTAVRLDSRSVNALVTKVILERGAGQLDASVLAPALSRFMGAIAADNQQLQALILKMRRTAN